LGLTANGNGTILLSGKAITNQTPLVVGTSYTLTAKPGTGFAFSNWTGSVIGTNASITFVMQTNTALTARFVDVASPSVAITAPKAKAAVSNATLQVSGTATDNGSVYAVYYRLNSNAWTLAQTTNHWSNWTASLALIAKSNTLQAYSADSASNLSKTASVSFTYIRTAPIGLSTNGNGTILLGGKAITNQTPLVVGSSYTLTAKPGAGCVFSNWSGSVSANTNVVTFTMSADTALRVSFVTNPFVAIAGVYQGLFTNLTGYAQTNSGFFQGTLTTNGALTAKVQQGSNSYSYSGQFSLDKTAYNSVPRKGLDNLSLQLTLQGTDILSGSISSAQWQGRLTAYRNIYSKNNPAPQGGKNYTLILFPPVGDNPVTSPAGNGYGAVGVDVSGNVTFAGPLGEGTTVTPAAIVSKQGLWPFYANYPVGGIVYGWLTFTNKPTTDISGSLTWIKQSQSSAKLYPNGFTNRIETAGSLYRFTNGTRALQLTNGVLILDNGNLAQSLTNSFILGVNNKATGTNMSLTITTKSGLFQGKATNSTTKSVISIKGALLQKQNVGYGQFQGASESGAVFIEPKQ
jgi:hypothetical protein